MLAEYKHIEKIPEDVDTWSIKVRGAASLSENLNAARDDAFLYRKLATLRNDAPIPQTLEELEWKGPNRPALEKFCEEIGESALLNRI